MPRDLDLNLDSLWFAKKPIAFPPPSIAHIKNTSYKISRKRTQVGSNITCKLTAAILWIDDMSITKLRLTWDPSNPRISVRAEQKHVPPPSTLSTRLLASAQQRYGGQIVRWCQERLGTWVGDGECWSLANDALQAVAAKCRSRGEEPVMVSHGRVHGVCIYARRMPSPGSGLDGLVQAQVAPGDILELRRATFRTQITRFEVVGFDTNKHTAVITNVNNGVMRVLQQNVPPAGRRVWEGCYNVREMIKSEMRIYRPFWESWSPFNLDW